MSALGGGVAVKKVPQPAHSQSYREPRTLNLERGRWQPPRALSHSRTAGTCKLLLLLLLLLLLPLPVYSLHSLRSIQGTSMLVLATDLS